MQLFRNSIIVLATLLTGAVLKAQHLEGIWSGKISRTTSRYAGVEGLEIQLFQSGNQIWGHTFAYKDTSRFVLFRANGRRNKKNKTLHLQETGNPYYQLPEGYFPCEKIFALNYHKIGNTQYLVGNWGGIGVGLDTSCFPGEDLIVVLQKLKKPDYPIETFVNKKLLDYFTRQNRLLRADTLSVAVQETPVVPMQTAAPPDPVAADGPAERLQDIQHILKVQDTLLRLWLYDNAIIDDDTITLFVNKKPVLRQQRISDKPIVLEIPLTEPGKPVEILMQAENLGSIPPNTALMIVECGRRRYEVRLSAGFEKHAVLIITYEPD